MARMDERNDCIRQMYQAGHSLADIGEQFRLTRQRIDQIIHIKKTRARQRASGAYRDEVHDCEKCGAPHAQMHHCNYDAPLEIEWLCRTCHVAEHKSTDGPSKHISIRMTDQRRTNLDTVSELADTSGDTATIDFALGYVIAAFKCPGCGERKEDELVWIDDDVVECQVCGAHYDPDEEDNGKDKPDAS